MKEKNFDMIDIILKAMLMHSKLANITDGDNPDNDFEAYMSQLGPDTKAVNAYGCMTKFYNLWSVLFDHYFGGIPYWDMTYGEESIFISLLFAVMERKKLITGDCVTFEGYEYYKKREKDIPELPDYLCDENGKFRNAGKVYVDYVTVEEEEAREKEFLKKMHEDLNKRVEENTDKWEEAQKKWMEEPHGFIIDGDLPF